MVKQVLVVLFILITPVLLLAQQHDSLHLPVVKDSTVTLNDSLRSVDSARLANTITNGIADSVAKEKENFSKTNSYTAIVQKLVSDHLYLNSTAKPITLVNRLKTENRVDHIFYLLLVLAASLSFFRFFYTRYFNNLFRVFFNASLRQSQLTDQLLQARLPSLLFNIVFILVGGCYIFLLLNNFHWIASGKFWLIMLYCTISLAVVYLVKYTSLKFTGWLTGYKQVTNTYIFIIFLINKILGILLLPFAVIIAFAAPALLTAAVIISLLLVVLMFILRFFRSYGLLQNQLKISRLHFFMYVIGIEVVPLLLIYKGLVLLLSKNL